MRCIFLILGEKRTMLPSQELFFKYDHPVPRYTSYPTYPHWNKHINQTQLKNLFLENSKNDNSIEISLYIHLPFCETLCYFCGCNKVITKKHNLEIPYINKLMIELDNYLNILNKSVIIKELHFGGGTPTFFSPENINFLLTEIFKRTKIAKNPDFSIEIHPKVTTSEHLDVLKDNNFSRLSIGVQDFDTNVQKIIGRDQKLEEIDFCTSYARKIGFNSINYDLIYGLPAQSNTTILNTLNTVFQLKPDRIAFYSYAHVPTLKPSQNKLNSYSIPSGYEKYLIYKTAFDSFIANGYQNLGFDHFALETDSLYQSFLANKLHRNFMGFTTQQSPILIGLGVSAISDFGMFYVQNKKSFSEYMEQTTNGLLNFEVGYILSEEDFLIKQHILNLSCYHKTVFSNNYLSSKTKEKIIYNLEPLINDNLIEFKNDEICVTNIGMAFLRNICFAFDQFATTKKTPNHSKSI